MIILYLPKTTIWNHLNDLRKNNKTAIFQINHNLLQHPRYSQYDLGKYGVIHNQKFLGTFESEEEATIHLRSIS